MKKAVPIIICTLALVLIVSPSFLEETFPNLEPLQDADLGAIVGEFGGAQCVGVVIGVSLTILFIGAFTGGVGLALGGAYLPLAVAAC